MAKEKQNIEPIDNEGSTSILPFGSNINNIVVETVASFENMMNYRNTKVEYTNFSYGENGIMSGMSIQPIHYDFKNSKEFKLLFKQTIKIIVDGKQTDLTEDNFMKVLDREHDVFEKALLKILEASDKVGFTIKAFATNM